MQEYIQLDRRLHLLCQVQAKVAANLIPKKVDYSHTNLGFDPIGKRILSRWMNNENRRVCLALDFNSFSFQWINESWHLMKDIRITGKTITQLETDIISSLNQHGFTTTRLEIGLEYEIAPYPFHNLPFEPLEKAALNKWMYFRSLANQYCDEVLRHMNATEEVRLWPHHFDTGFYIKINQHLGIGIGLAMEDNMVESPYFYTSGYGLQHDISMTHLPVLNHGSWKTDEWKGAVLPITDLIKFETGKHMVILRKFISTCLNWYMTKARK